MKTLALISMLGTCLVACSGSDPAGDGPGTDVTDGGDEPKRDTTVTTDPSCPKKGDTDELDANGTDDNCDGIDGVLSDTVFVVAGAPQTGKGIPADPVGSIAKAAEIAKASSKHHVYVCMGTFTEAAEIVAPADLHVHGGFACDRNWRRIGADPRTTWTSASAEALRITGGAKVSFDHFDITAGNAVEAGGSSVAVALNGVAEVELSELTVTAGDGAPGIAGADGAPQLAPRAKSANGESAWTKGLTVYGRAQDCTLPGGPANAAGTGGTAFARVREAGDSGGNSSDGTDGGDWRMVPSGDLWLLSNLYTVGSNGADGTAGSNAGPGPVGGSLVDARYVPASGTAGTAGTNGRSGGGGAPGQGVETCFGHPGTFAGTWVCTTARRIQGGGAGGSGGCYGAGGAGGGAGGGGGASIALVSSQSTLTLRNVLLRTSAGGNGGAGGAGTAGQTGGEGGNGGSGSDMDSQDPNLGGTQSANIKIGYSGYRGGNGGNGGAGGAGSAGAGGPSVALYVVGPAPVVDATVTYEVGTGGSGGAAVGGGQRGVDGPSERSVTQ